MKTGILEYSNAGHNPPYLLKNDGTILKLESTGDMALGCFEDKQFSTKRVQLNPNDGIILYTDGVTEAFNREMEEYGEERLEKLLPTLQPMSVDKIVNGIAGDVADFAKGVSQADDITLLSMKYFG